MPDPNYPMGLEIRKLECRKIIEILGKGDIKRLMKIYIPRTVASVQAATDSRPHPSNYVSGLYIATANKEIRQMVLLSMAMVTMDRVMIPHWNRAWHINYCLKSRSCFTLRVHDKRISQNICALSLQMSFQPMSSPCSAERNARKKPI